jgi:hypothetical protein
MGTVPKNIANRHCSQAEAMHIDGFKLSFDKMQSQKGACQEL